MTKKMFTLILGLFIMLSVGRSLGALNAVPDGTRHAALGATCIQVNEGDPWQCLPGSAFLVTPQIMVSVAHACPWLDSVRPAHKGVTFDEKIISPSKVYEIDQFICDPLFAWDTQDPHDLAVVFLKGPVTNIRPMSLPPILDFLDKGNLAYKTYVTLVDRSLTTLVGWPDLPVWGNRTYGTFVITDLRPGAIMLTPNENHPTQACYGASGSAALFTNTNVAVGVGSWFTDWTSDCNGPTGYTRLDTTQARDFLQRYLPENLLPK
jgi:hypothetical protein